MDSEEIKLYYQKYDYLVGVDEVGRGPLAGPVTVAVFAVHKKYYDEVFEFLYGITDSKKLSEQKRLFFVEKIKKLKKEKKIIIHITSSSAKMINDRGIIFSLQKALQRCLSFFDSSKSFVFLDGSLFAPDYFSQKTIIKGDLKNWLIGAASVVAKVSRDDYMISLSRKYTKYEFEKNKGYGTKKHKQAIQKYGITCFHRESWIKK